MRRCCFLAEVNKKKPGPYWKKAGMAALVMAAACITLIFFGPFESLSNAGNAMQYAHQDIWLPLALISAAVFTLGTGLLPLLKGRLFRYTITVIFGLTLCGYLQAVLMNGRLGPLDGNAYTIPGGAAIFNLVVWLIILVGCCAVLQLSRRFWRILLRFGSLLLAVMQLVSVCTIAFGSRNQSTQTAPLCLTEAGMYEYSEGSNIFVFVLDRFDQSYVEEILKEDPTFFDGMDGFTRYTNAISAYARTQPALNQLLTGSETAFHCTKEEFYANSWQEDSKEILADLEAQGYTNELYTNFGYLFSDGAYAKKYVENAAPVSKINIGAVLPKMLRLSAYRCSPLICKPLFWSDTNYYNEGVLTASDVRNYEFNDSYYGPGFRDADTTRESNCFKFYHFYGSHSPYTMNADGTASQEETSAREQTIGCFTHLFAAFDRMKELGIYEDATIIITGDHGSAIKDSEPLLRATTMGFFYKPAGSAGTPLAYSNAPVCTDNVGATIVKAAGLKDYSAYGPALDDISEDSDIVRYYYKSVADKETWHEVKVCKYEVTGDAKNFDNWKLVETLDPVEEENRFY